MKRFNRKEAKPWFSLGIVLLIRHKMNFSWKIFKQVWKYCSCEVIKVFGVSQAICVNIITNVIILGYTECLKAACSILKEAPFKTNVDNLWWKFSYFNDIFIYSFTKILMQIYIKDSLFKVPHLKNSLLSILMYSSLMLFYKQFYL